MIRAATTLADPCTGAQRRDFLRGMRRGQLAGAHVPSWCSRHGVDAGCSQRAGPPGQLTTCAYQTLAEGTGVDAPDGLGVPEWRVLKTTPGGIREPGEHRRTRSRQVRFSGVSQTLA